MKKRHYFSIITIFMFIHIVLITNIEQDPGKFYLFTSGLTLLISIGFTLVLILKEYKI